MPSDYGQTFFLLQSHPSWEAEAFSSQSPVAFATWAAIDDSLKINRATSYLIHWFQIPCEGTDVELQRCLWPDILYLSSGCKSGAIPSAELCCSVFHKLMVLPLLGRTVSVAVPAHHFLDLGAWICCLLGIRFCRKREHPEALVSLC